MSQPRTCLFRSLFLFESLPTPRKPVRRCDSVPILLHLGASPIQIPLPLSRGCSLSRTPIWPTERPTATTLTFLSGLRGIRFENPYLIVHDIPKPVRGKDHKLQLGRAAAFRADLGGGDQTGRLSFLDETKCSKKIADQPTNQRCSCDTFVDRG